jgi:hypothetical protein
MDDAARRLKEELERVFGSVSESWRALGLKQIGALHTYLSGQSGIGPKMRSRLEAAGVDIGYILTGRHSVSEPAETEVAFTSEELQEIERETERMFAGKHLWGPKEIDEVQAKELKTIIRKFETELILRRRKSGDKKGT